MRGQGPRGQRRAARWVDAAARLGHVATGSVYMIVGVVAGLACFDARMRPLGTQGALHRALKGDLGAIALLAIALGLTADAVWQMVRAAVDADRVGPGITGAIGRSESPEAPGLSVGHGGACRSIEGCHGLAGAPRTLGGLEERPGLAGALRTLGG